MNDDDSRKVVEILNNGFIAISDSLIEIKECIENIDESLMLILKQMKGLD